jgi:hypothetical protein
VESLYNLSVEQVKYQARDRLSFTHFLALGIEDRIPAGTTLRLFREKLAKARLIEKLVEQFSRQNEARSYIIRAGQMVDATICRYVVKAVAGTRADRWKALFFEVTNNPDGIPQSHVPVNSTETEYAKEFKFFCVAAAERFLRLIWYECDVTRTSNVLSIYIRKTPLAAHSRAIVPSRELSTETRSLFPGAARYGPTG